MNKCITALAVCVALLSGCTNKPTVSSVRCKEGVGVGAVSYTTPEVQAIGFDPTYVVGVGNKYHLIYTYWSDGTVTNNYDIYFKNKRITPDGVMGLKLAIAGGC